MNLVEMFHSVIFQKNEARPFMPLHTIAWATLALFIFFLHGSLNWAYIFRCHVNKKDYTGGRARGGRAPPPKVK